MPQNIAWLIEKQIIIIYATGDVTLEEMQANDAEMAAYLAAGDPPVHMLADIKDLGRFPFDLIGLRKTTTYLQHPNLGHIAVYGASRMASSFAQMIVSLAGVKARFVRDYVDAINYLAQHDPRIKEALEAGTIPKEA
ncbi:MAG: STAS/SEC14 domain-containing protein [Chloroflexi bacterium CFX4]|nr:STAS/SEC14 domain-containing protein [Chloroflexi bacterium CFX4]MDL1923145.1 STAS/SEC14 domain-containing protein [Chloroflexi bacterium CFX3]